MSESSQIPQTAIDSAPSIDAAPAPPAPMALVQPTGLYAQPHMKKRDNPVEQHGLLGKLNKLKGFIGGGEKPADDKSSAPMPTSESGGIPPVATVGGESQTPKMEASGMNTESAGSEVGSDSPKLGAPDSAAGGESGHPDAEEIKGLRNSIATMGSDAGGTDSANDGEDGKSSKFGKKVAAAVGVPFAAAAMTGVAGAQESTAPVVEDATAQEQVVDMSEVSQPGDDIELADGTTVSTSLDQDQPTATTPDATPPDMATPADAPAPVETSTTDEQADGSTSTAEVPAETNADAPATEAGSEASAEQSAQPEKYIPKGDVRDLFDNPDSSPYSVKHPDGTQEPYAKHMNGGETITSSDKLNEAGRKELAQFMEDNNIDDPVQALRQMGTKYATYAYKVPEGGNEYVFDASVPQTLVSEGEVVGYDEATGAATYEAVMPKNLSIEEAEKILGRPLTDQEKQDGITVMCQTDSMRLGEGVDAPDQLAGDTGVTLMYFELPDGNRAQVRIKTTKTTCGFGINQPDVPVEAPPTEKTGLDLTKAEKNPPEELAYTGAGTGLLTGVGTSILGAGTGLTTSARALRRREGREGRGGRGGGDGEGSGLMRPDGQPYPDIFANSKYAKGINEADKSNLEHAFYDWMRKDKAGRAYARRTFKKIMDEANELVDIVSDPEPDDSDVPLAA